ncbi:hypothetical protein VTK56DRAFT_7903 [Thermocarpiscus australiensis]
MRCLPALLSIGLSLSRGLAAPGFAHEPNRRAVPRGVLIEHCTVPGVVALTFDDGPYIHTSHVLDLLDSYDAKATFFVNGENWSSDIDSASTPWPGILRRMDRSGHQIGSHTWSHVDLSSASSETRRYQISELEIALGNVLGKVPTYFRPPYGSCSADCLSDVGEMGYHVVNYDVDTKDYLYNSPDLIEMAKDLFSEALDAGGEDASFLVLSHDTLQSTAETLVPFMLDKIRERGYKAVTVGECLGDPARNWYRPV